jgi:hypothetical protein
MNGLVFNAARTCRFYNHIATEKETVVLRGPHLHRHEIVTRTSNWQHRLAAF